MRQSEENKKQIAALYQEIHPGIHHKHHKLITVKEKISLLGFHF